MHAENRWLLVNVFYDRPFSSLGPVHFQLCGLSTLKLARIRSKTNGQKDENWMVLTKVDGHLKLTIWQFQNRSGPSNFSDRLLWAERFGTYLTNGQFLKPILTFSLILGEFLVV